MEDGEEGIVESHDAPKEQTLSRTGKGLAAIVGTRLVAVVVVFLANGNSSDHPSASAKAGNDITGSNPNVNNQPQKTLPELKSTKPNNLTSSDGDLTGSDESVMFDNDPAKSELLDDSTGDDPEVSEITDNSANDDLMVSEATDDSNVNDLRKR